MRALLDRYIRSLLEQEQARDAPEYRQDLGTFVDWLLARQGFRVVERTFRHDGPVRRGARGERQWGADILAVTTDDDNVHHGYRFVLKQGAIGSAQWRMEDGFLPQDLLFAAQRHPDDIKKYDPSIQIRRWTVVAVHNGDFRADQVGDLRRSLLESLPRVAHGVDFQWWDANRLVDLALAPTKERARLDEHADPDLFPPGVRPFARLAIDSLVHGTNGTRFDIDAIERLIDTALPKADNVDQGRWERSVSQLGLLAAMIDVEARRLTNVHGSTLPGLEVLLRVICRAAWHVALWGDSQPTREQRYAVDLLQLLLSQYTGIARRLRRHLGSVLQLDRGLAVASLSEQIDYPIRSLHLASHLAIAGGAALDIGDRKEAEAFADALHQLVMRNPGGALSPVMDDQITELALIWDIWRRLGQDARIRDTAQELANRFSLRRAFGLPLPALGLSAEIPPDPRAMRILVETNYRREPPGFEDGGSQILPLALYLGWRDLDIAEADRAFSRLVFGSTNSASSESNDKQAGTTSRTIYLQSWLPPDDAPRLWYSEPLAHRGTAHVYRLQVYPMGRSFTDFVNEFERFNRSLPIESIAVRLGLESIDRMAWKRYRNPPPLALFHIDRGGKSIRA